MRIKVGQLYNRLCYDRLECVIVKRIWLHDSGTATLQPSGPAFIFGQPLAQLGSVGGIVGNHGCTASTFIKSVDDAEAEIISRKRNKEREAEAATHWQTVRIGRSEVPMIMDRLIYFLLWPALGGGGVCWFCWRYDRIRFMSAVLIGLGVGAGVVGLGLLMVGFG